MSIATGTGDFIAVLYYHTVEQGGRSNPVFNSYRPQVKFAFSEMQTGGQQKFINKEIVYPGDIVEAEVQLLLPNIFEKKLAEGMKFEFREGSKIIGTGEIKAILNQQLKKPVEIDNQSLSLKVL